MIKGSHHSIESKIKIGNESRGRYHNEETKQRMRTAHLGEKNYWFGKHHTDETKQKLREYNFGKHHSEETKEKMRGKNNPMWGKHLSEEAKRKLQESRGDISGEKNYWFGKHLSDDHKKKISIKNSGENHGNWKGDDVGNIQLHTWIKKRKIKTVLCELCDAKEPKELANISGEYKRDVDDFMWVCLSCHKTYDGIVNNFNR